MAGDRTRAFAEVSACGLATALRLNSLLVLLDRVELNVLAAAVERNRLQQADGRCVELVLAVRLDQRVVLRLQNVPGEAPVRDRPGRGDAEHLARVLRDTGGVLLAVDIPHVRRGFPDVSGWCSVDAC